jgi:hypothetical protein
MKFRNSVISIGLASLLIGCGSDGDVDKVNKDSGSAMLKSELIYNQVIASKTKEAVMPYIKSKFGGQKPTEQNIKDIETAVRNAKSMHPNKKPAAVTAAVINKVMAIATSNPDGIKDITVTAQEITDADVPSLAKLEITKSFSVSNDDEIQRQNSLGWIDAKDSELVSITAKNRKVVGGSKYHNGLTVIDIATKGKVFSPVSIITDHGHHIDSASGASENRLEGVVLSSDASFVYVNIPHKKYNPATADGETVGLYKAKIEADGSIKTIETALAVGSGKRLSIDETNSKRLNKIVKKFAVASDDSKVVVLDSEDNLFVYDGNLINELAAIETDGMEAVAINGNTVFVAVDENITKMSASDLSTTGQIELAFKAKGIIVNSDGTKLIAYNDETKIAVVNLVDNSINASSILYEADTVSVSDDFTKVALAGEHEKSVLVVNLTVPGFSIQGKYNATSETVAFVGNDKLAIGEGTGIAILNIATTTENNNLASKIASAKNGLNYSSINNGNYFNSTVKDMNLPKSYENVNIAWTSTLPVGNLNPADGNVTRPEVGSENVSGVLTAILSSTFRGEEVKSNKALNITVKKLVPTVAVTSTFPLTNSFRGGFMSVSENNKVASLNKDGNVGGIYILDKDNNAGATFHLFNDSDTAEDGISVSYILENQIVAVTNAGNIYRYTVNGANALTEIQKITLSAQEKVSAATFNSDRTKLAILVSDESGNYKTKLYDIAGDGTVTYKNDVDMKKLSYSSQFAINDDASIIYTRSEGEVINAQDGATHTSVTIDERVAGVWYVDNKPYVTTRTGKIITFANANLTGAKTETDTGHNGRIYTLAEANGKLFAFLYAKNTDDGGISILDAISLEELQFIPAKATYKGAVSADGTKVYSFNYNKPRNLSYINLQ